ncbi:MAG: DUF2207 domain-containing protein [Gemmatimonadaceae bacterium]
MIRILAFLVMWPVMQLAGQEHIVSYDSRVDIRRDGSLDVTEKIVVVAAGQQIRRGIYRDFPTRYRDRFGNQVKVDLEVIGVERNGKQEPWFTERMSNGVRINTGNDDFLTVPAQYTYTLRYRTTRQLGFFAKHDELYWNAIGTSWVFPIDSGTVEVRLPEAVPVERVTAEAYTGAQGARGSAYVAEVAAPGMARYRLTAPLPPNEGFTVVLTFPKGIVSAPGDAERAQSFLRDNRGVLVAFAGLLVLLAYMWREWSRVGRDPRKGIVIARYEPRPGQTPAGLRFMQRMGYDMRCFSADVLALAVAGYIGINRDEKFLKDEWRLDRGASASPPTPEPTQLALLQKLFSADRESVVLKNKNAAILSKVRDAHSKSLRGEFDPRYFKVNGGKVGIAIVIAVVTGGLAFIGSGGYGIPAIIVAVVLMLISVSIFARLVRAPTAEGRELLDEIEGLKLYMKVAERDELSQMRGPDEPSLDAKRYETMLPFAVALEVEDAWTDKFTQAVGEAVAATTANSMTWYSGRGPISNLGDFSNAIGSSLSSQISSASTPPGGSSGSGGGGSSGGGGGGGGGGGR